MRRIFVDKEKISGKSAIIKGQEARHLGLVLRAKLRDQIELFDGSGHVYLAEIDSISKTTIETTIISSREIIDNPPFLHLGIGLIKSKKMDLIIQKANELGVSSIYPITSQNCAVSPPTTSQYKRWKRIVQESCKQCGRPRPLICHPYIDFTIFVKQQDLFDTKIVFWENEEGKSLGQIEKFPDSKSALLLIGPEGGFQDEEIKLAARHNFIPTTLGSKILRAETAAISAISISQFLLGNLDK